MMEKIPRYNDERCRLDAFCKSVLRNEAVPSWKGRAIYTAPQNKRSGFVGDDSAKHIMILPR